MGTNYHRQFRPMAWLLLAAILILGIIFHIFLYDIIITTNEDTLYRNAKAVADLTLSYYTSGNATNILDYWMDLSFAARLTGAKMLLCDAEGYVILCSEDFQGCEHTGKQIDGMFVEATFSKGRTASSNMLTKIYEDPHLSVAVPVEWDGEETGIVIASFEMSRIHSTLLRATRIFLTIALGVLAVTLIAMLLLTKRQNRPLRELSEAARLLGHGNLNVRVQTGGQNSREFDELAVAFNNMATSLQSAETRRQEFVADVSHELKTPMTIIAGYMDGMLDGTIPKERHAYYMQIISNEVRRLSRLVRSMLEISRMQDQGVDESKKSRFDVCDMVGQTLLTFEQRINEKELDVQVDMPNAAVYTFADQDAINQVVYNLMDNAVKFCDRAGTLGVSVKPNGGKLQVAISNTGATISPEELPLVFDRFHKTDKSRSMNPDGAGLGLYIVKTIICGHGENIAVTSRDGKTEFSFTLPQVRQRGKEGRNDGRSNADGARGDSGTV